MRYFTREMDAKLQRSGAFYDFESIEDREYSEAEIRAFYKKKLDERLASELEDYEYMKSVSAGDIAFCDAGTEDGEQVLSEEDASALNEQLAAALETLKDAPPPDPKRVEREFRASCRARIRQIGGFYPEWLHELGDLRLFSYGYLNKSAYDRLKAECEQMEREYETMKREYREECERQNIPERINKAFYTHDDELLGIRKRGKALEMYLRRCGGFDESEEYRRITFKDAQVLERDRSLAPRLSFDEDGKPSSNITFLYFEIFRSERGYEVHTMFFKYGKDSLKYLTVDCADVVYEDGAGFNL